MIESWCQGTPWECGEDSWWREPSLGTPGCSPQTMMWMWESKGPWLPGESSKWPQRFVGDWRKLTFNMLNPWQNRSFASDAIVFSRHCGASSFSFGSQKEFCTSLSQFVTTIHQPFEDSQPKHTMLRMRFSPLQSYSDIMISIEKSSETQFATCFLFFVGGSWLVDGRSYRLQRQSRRGACSGGAGFSGRIPSEFLLVHGFVTRFFWLLVSIILFVFRLSLGVISFSVIYIDELWTCW